MSVYCTLFSQTFYGLLFCYLTITDVHVTLYLQIIDFQFTSCCTSQPPKKLDQIITVNSSTNTPRSYHQKNNSCTLCVPMFICCKKLQVWLLFCLSARTLGISFVKCIFPLATKRGSPLLCRKSGSWGIFWYTQFRSLKLRHITLSCFIISFCNVLPARSIDLNIDRYIYSTHPSFLSPNATHGRARGGFI